MPERQPDITPPYDISLIVVEKGDIDQYGHVNYKAIFSILEPSQDQYMESRGIGFATIEEKYGLRSFVKALGITYEGQLFLGDLAVVRTQIAKVGRTSIVYQQQLFARKQRIADFGMTVVLVDKEGNPTEVPAELRQKLEPPKTSE